MREITANWYTTGALLAWPLIALWLYTHLPVNRATLWTIVGGYLLLPVGAAIKFEMIPAFDKNSIPNLAALFGCVLIQGRSLRFWSKFGLVEVLLLMWILGPLVTSAMNTDPLVYGPITLSGESLYDGTAAVVGRFLFLLPFFLGRQLFRSAADTEEVLRVLVVAGLFYSVPVLFEVRMSPQLHAWVYGYFPHDFAQQVRDGGFRAVVFLGHGLLVAFFMATTVVAASAFWRTRTVILRVRPDGLTAYLMIVLVLCKSLGGLLLGAGLALLVRFTQPRLQVRIASLLAALTVLYPLLRGADVVPTTLMVETARLVSDDRAESLQTRFDQEKTLLEHAWQRPLFGWGRFGRNRVFDVESERDVSITDGRWVLSLGVYGLFGFVAEFGLLALAVFRAAPVINSLGEMRDRVYLAALVLILAMSLVDLLPNDSLRPWSWLVAGAVVGRAEFIRATRGRTIGRATAQRASQPPGRTVVHG